MGLLDSVVELFLDRDLVDAVKHGPTPRVLNVGEAFQAGAHGIDEDALPNFSFVRHGQFSLTGASVYRNEEGVGMQLKGMVLSNSQVELASFATFPPPALANPSEANDLIWFGNIRANADAQPYTVNKYIRSGGNIFGRGSVGGLYRITFYFYNPTIGSN